VNLAKRALVGASEWLAGPKLRELAGDAWRRNFQPRDPSLALLRDRHAGRGRCFVIGNGPSLKGMDLTRIAGDFSIGANSFYKHPDAARVGLGFLCIFDPHFMKDEPRGVEWHRTVEKLLPGTSFMLHHSARALVQKHGLYPGREVFYARSGIQTHEASRVDFDFRRPRNVGMTTGSSIAIQLAIYLGFREIYLVGFDCNWLENTGASYHFYEAHEYFPEFDSIAADGRGIGYENFLKIIQREFESHRLIRARAEAAGVRIFNATDGGLLDAYPRVSYAGL